MIIKRLTVENVGPFFGSWEVLLETGVTVFVGEYEGAEDRSNRSGKSWLAVDVPTYAIFGVFRGARVEDLPHRLVRGRESAWAEVEVESSDGLEWVVRRGRTAGGDPIRELNGSQISERDLERVVREEVVGLSWEEYLLTLGAVQGEMHAFMRLTAGEKRRVVSP
jgi:DNA repair exonuclease SbcCD ATPase subunit